MISKLVEEGSKRSFGRLWDDLFGYFRVYDFLKMKTMGAFKRPKKISSVASFWYSILGDKFTDFDLPDFQPLEDGDILRFSDVFISEWIPKLPGRIWTKTGQLDLVT